MRVNPAADVRHFIAAHEVGHAVQAQLKDLSPDYFTNKTVELATELGATCLAGQVLHAQFTPLAWNNLEEYVRSTALSSHPEMFVGALNAGVHAGANAGDCSVASFQAQIG